MQAYKAGKHATVEIGCYGETVIVTKIDECAATKPKAKLNSNIFLSFFIG